MSQKLVTLFPLWAIILSVVAFFYPDYFSGFKPAIIPLLSLVMFGMGMTLTWGHFKSALQQPAIITLTVAIQFLFMPLFAYLLATLLKLPTEQLIGLVLVGSSAGGTASNVICYLARGDVALSILMTMTSTLTAIVLMPLLTYLYLQHTVTVPVMDMMQSILFIVLLPVIAGTAINSFYWQRLQKVTALFPLLSSLAIIIIIAIIVGLNHNNLQKLSLPILAAVMLHNLFGLMTGYAIPRLLNYDPVTCRTVSIEVGMQNSGLSVALAIQYFSTLAALPGALFSIWHNISGALLAAYWRRLND
jgi:bile acid:Na+ symporter, BASS family